MTKIPLLDLFYQLRDTGLPLTIDQYYLAVDALKKSIDAELDFISDELAIKQLCRIVWVKSKQQKNLFDECWENWKENSLSQTQDKYSISKPTRSADTREQEQTPPPQDNQDDILDNTPISSEDNSLEEELIIPIPAENHNVITAIKITENSQKLNQRDYYPVSRRKLQLCRDKLMLSSPKFIPNQLDIQATITDIAKRGFFNEPIFTAAQIKEKEIVLLIDREGSMAPFHPFCRQLVEIWKAAKVYYFHNSPTDELYRDPKCWDGKSIKSIFQKFSQKNTLVVIVSDAGAARQRSVLGRYEETYDFLELLIPLVQRVAWLNPLPRFRWQDNTAEEIAKINVLAPMFALEPREFQQMMQWLLYGKPSIRKFLNNAWVKATKENSELKKHQSSNSNSSNSWDLEFDTTGRIEKFKEQFGEFHLDFVSHAAFPLVLTPDLLYCLWNDFFRKSSSQKKSQFSSLSKKSKQSPKSSKTENPKEVPWYAVADLLLSDLCQQVYSSSNEEELYEIERDIRNELLKRCQEKFGKQTIENLSDFLIQYINRQLNKQSNQFSLSFQESQLYEVQQWAALAYTKPSEAAIKLASKLQQAYLHNNKPELIRLSQVAETFVEALQDYKPLLEVAWGYAATSRGDRAGTEASQNKLKQELDLVGDKMNIAGVLLELPDINKIPFLLQKFDFATVTINRNGEIINQETKQARYFTQTIISSTSGDEEFGFDISLEMVYIPGGTFLMGTEDEEIERLLKKFENDYFREEAPQHQVTVPNFFMGRYQVTQEQWKAVAALPQVERELRPDPSHFKGDDLPVEKVDWYDAVEFCARLSNHTGRRYSLPTEAEWEYACRAGTTTPLQGSSVAPGGNPHDRADSPFHFGETISSDLANYNASKIYANEAEGEYREKTTPVGQFPPNAFGLHDMHGNVWEWCLDDWHNNYEKAPTDGSAWFDEENDNLSQKQEIGVLRGGSWVNIPEDCRSASRNYDVRRGNYISGIGFRVVCAVGRT
ncbi:MAG: SUMF1/EgtB/PvdO family nonheme iron enzyme [Richelia sp. RM1_1_1]|nr:SUMF1/EgtB/PvdO family nonheme iron enzyme [Richelia sp. RM1_1_1]